MAGDYKDTNPKDAAATTRLDLSLAPQSAIAYMALAMAEGDLKYGGYNYRAAGVQVSVYIAALMRHVFKYYNGEWADPKTRVPHLANALACLAVLVDSIEQGNVNDDRPPRQDTAGLLSRMEENVAHLHKIFPRKADRYRHKKGDPLGKGEASSPEVDPNSVIPTADAERAVEALEGAIRGLARDQATVYERFSGGLADWGQRAVGTGH